MAKALWEDLHDPGYSECQSIAGAAVQIVSAAGCSKSLDPHIISRDTLKCDV